MYNNYNMIQNKGIFFIGVFILIVSSSFIALPSLWKTILIFLSGVILILSSIRFTLPKKPQKRLRKKDKQPVIFTDSGVISVEHESDDLSNTNDMEKDVLQTQKSPDLKTE